MVLLRVAGYGGRLDPPLTNPKRLSILALYLHMPDDSSALHYKFNFSLAGRLGLLKSYTP